MSGSLTAKALAPVIAEAPALVHEALQTLYDPREDPLDLDAVAVAARGVGRTTAAMLAMILNEDGLSEAFVAFLAAHARPLDRPAFAATVARLKAESGMAILLIDKSLKELSGISDRAVVLQRGTTVWSGPMAELTPDISEKLIGV